MLTDAGNLKELLTVYLVFNSLKALTDHGGTVDKKLETYHSGGSEDIIKLLLKKRRN